MESNNDERSVGFDRISPIFEFRKDSLPRLHKAAPRVMLCHSGDICEGCTEHLVLETAHRIL
jgi:hypothetical protein